MENTHPERIPTLARAQACCPDFDVARTKNRTRREPFNFTPMGVNPVSSGPPHVRPIGRTCGEPDEIKKNTHPKNITTFFRD